MGKAKHKAFSNKESQHEYNAFTNTCEFCMRAIEKWESNWIATFQIGYWLGFHICCICSGISSSSSLYFLLPLLSSVLVRSACVDQNSCNHCIYCPHQLSCMCCATQWLRLVLQVDVATSPTPSHPYTYTYMVTTGNEAVDVSTSSTSNITIDKALSLLPLPLTSAALSIAFFCTHTLSLFLS